MRKTKRSKTKRRNRKHNYLGKARIKYYSIKKSGGGNIYSPRSRRRDMTPTPRLQYIITPRPRRTTPEQVSAFELKWAEAEKADTDRIAAEKAEANKAEADRIAAEKAEANKAEADRIAAEKAEADKAEADRMAAEADRIAAKKAASRAIRMGALVAAGKAMAVEERAMEAARQANERAKAMRARTMMAENRKAATAGISDQPLWGGRYV
jgi:hypothetical protein